MSQYHHIGHRDVIRVLKKQIESQRIHHTYIFIGPPHIGKLDLAKYFASLIHDPRNQIQLREKLENSVHPDTIIIHPAKAKKTYKRTISIKEIKKLQRKINLTPHSSNFKIGIIADVHLLTLEAANAFLKTLEEPPKASVLILTTSNQNLILPTILSRCQKIYLGLVSQKEIYQNLIERNIGKNAAQMISRLAAGKPGLAIELAEEDILNDYRQNLSDLEKLFRLNDADRIKRVEAIYKQKDILEVLDNWLVYFRDLLIEKNNLADMEINFDREEMIKKQSLKLSNRKIENILRKIIESKNMLIANANPKLVLENLVLEF